MLERLETPLSEINRLLQLELYFTVRKNYINITSYHFTTSPLLVSKSTTFSNISIAFNGSSNFKSSPSSSSIKLFGMNILPQIRVLKKITWRQSFRPITPRNIEVSYLLNAALTIEGIFDFN
jgi:hypothetical protein